MSSIDEKTTLELTDRLNEARIIIDEQGLYNIWDNIPKSGDPDRVELEPYLYRDITLEQPYTAIPQV